MIDYAYKETSLDKDYNLTMYCFLVIDALVEYSSHDKLDKFTEMLAYFLDRFDETFHINNSITVEIAYQYQSYYCNILRVILKKSFKKIPKETASNIYTRINNSFIQRKGVYDEAILTVSALASNLKDEFEPIMEPFSNYLVFALEKYNETSLCKAAILTLAEIVRAIGFNFYKYSDRFIPILITILTHHDVSRTNKTVTITTLGDICMTIDQYFVPYMDNVIELLLSAAEMASSQAEDVNKY